MPAATITSKGQMTIPKKIRDLLHLEAGDRIDFIIGRDGKVVIEPATIDVRDLEGILHQRGRRPVSLAAMDKAVKRRFGKKP